MFIQQGSFLKNSAKIDFRWPSSPVGLKYWFDYQLEKYKAKGASSVRFVPICQNGVSTTFSTHHWVLILSAIARYDRKECSRYLQNVHSMRRKFSTGPQSWESNTFNQFLQHFWHLQTLGHEIAKNAKIQPKKTCSFEFS